jgi:glycosyltransferase involved in cell wall biosynthesis
VEPVKRLEDAIMAAGRLRDSGHDVCLSLVGEGDPAYSGRLRSVVEAEGLGGIVRFVGPLRHGPELFRWYRESHVLVVCSASEGSPKVIIEAMANGVPVVATSVGGVPWLIGSDCGTLVPPGDPDRLATAIADIYERPDLWRRMSGAAASRASTMTMERTGELLEAAVAGARPPSRRRGARRAEGP